MASGIKIRTNEFALNLTAISSLCRQDCEDNAFFPEFYPIISEGAGSLEILLEIGSKRKRDCQGPRVRWSLSSPGMDLQHVELPQQLQQSRAMRFQPMRLRTTLAPRRASLGASFQLFWCYDPW